MCDVVGFGVAVAVPAPHYAVAAFPVCTPSALLKFHRFLNLSQAGSLTTCLNCVNGQMMSVG